MARSLNRVELIGNVTADPELRYTPSGAAVCSFTLATNREWKTEQGEKREVAQYHKMVAWAKLAELCVQLLNKGKKIYCEGRIEYGSYEKDGIKHNTVEIALEDFLLIEKKEV